MIEHLISPALGVSANTVIGTHTQLWAMYYFKLNNSLSAYRKPY